MEGLKFYRSLKAVKILVFIILLLIFFSSPLYAMTRDEYVSLIVKKSEALSRTNKHHKAIAYIKKAIKLQPGKKSLYYQRAVILARSGNYGYSIKELSRFVKDKNYPLALRYRADCYMAINNPAMAIKDYKVFLKRNKTDGKVWSYLVEALYLAGDKKGALKAADIGISYNSHWNQRLRELKKKIIHNQKIIPHKPFSN